MTFFFPIAMIQVYGRNKIHSRCFGDFIHGLLAQRSGIRVIVDVASRDVFSRFRKWPASDTPAAENRHGGASAVWLLAVILVASEVLYLALLRLDAVNGVWPVVVFLAILGAAFVLCFAAYLILRSAPASLPVKVIVVGGA
ncbi:MAG: hypothetical protein WB510_18090, partial [Candidatus Sulfotelmatobacter sp.]